MNILWMILIAALVSFGFRIAPIIFLKFFNLPHEHPLFIFLNYAVYAIMGCIIYTTAFPHSNWHLFASSSALLEWAKATLLLLALITGCYYRNITVLVICFVGLYALIVLGIPHTLVH